MDDKPDLINTAGGLSHALKEAEQLMESTINAYDDAVKIHANAHSIYRSRLSLEIMTLKNDGMSVTLIGDLARGVCHIEKCELLEAEGMLKKCRMLFSKAEHRLNDVKHISNKIGTLSRG